MTRRPSPAFDALLREIAARQQGMLIVHCDESLAGGRAGHKLYVDGNMARGLSGHAAFDTWVVPMTEGPHRVVLREFDALKPGRAESNTLHIELGPRQEMRLSARSSNGALCLSHAPAMDATTDEPSRFAMPALDLTTLEEALVAWSIKAITAFAAAHPQETFCAFGFDCHADHGNVLLCLNTEAAFEKTVTEWNDTPDEIAALKNSFGDWAYHGLGRYVPSCKHDWSPHERTILDYLGFNEIRDEERDQILEELMCCCCRALVRVEQSRILDRLQRTPDFFTLVIDHDEDAETAARRLQRVRQALRA